MRGLIAASAGALALVGCVSAPQAPSVPPPAVITPVPTPVPTPTPAPVSDNALLAGVMMASPQPLMTSDAAPALEAFKRSCPALMKRSDASGLTQKGDWDALCAAASSVTPTGAASFFRDRFAWVRVGEGKAFATGYYEPEIKGSLTRQPGYDVPIYGLPSDLTRCTRADGGEGRGRIDASGQCILYYTRGEIEDGVLGDKAPVIAWAADPIALFFLEIQGSGLLRLPDGRVQRIGYAGQNGREYVAIGRLLKDRGLVEGKVTMQAIDAWLRAHPVEGKALMRENLSYIFFRLLNTEGPLGALEVPVTARDSVAADPKFIPLGAPVFLTMQRAEANGLWIAQDTGGAIKGANRIDTFWGNGPDAVAIAGPMQSEGAALILLPPAAAQRALARP